MADNHSTQTQASSNVVIVTGGGNGIGAAIVRRFHNDGCTVIIADISAEAGGALATSLGERAIFMHCDVTDEESVAKLVDDTVAHFGTLTTFINNAGICHHNHLQPFFEISAEDFDTTNAVNYRGVFLGMKHASRVMAAKKSPNQSIVNIASIAGIRGSGSECASYQAAKAAVVGLTGIGAAKLCPYGIRVNAVSPSVTDTKMVEMAMATSDDDNLKAIIMARMVPLTQRYIHPDEIANATAFLACAGASSINGLNILVDQGWAAGAEGVPNLSSAS